MGKKSKARQKALAARSLAGIADSDRQEVARPDSTLDVQQLAIRLNSVAIYLQRRLKREDADSGVTTARLSALAVLAYGGQHTLGSLAAAEGVRPPSMTRLVTAMEADGLVERIRGADDGRLVMVRATPRGEQLINEGGERRPLGLAAWLRAVEPRGLAALDEAVGVLEDLIREHRG